MKEFGIVTEGITDQVVLENILYGFFKDKDLPVDPLSPLRDATDRNKAATSSNWIEVFEYCKSSRFKEASSYQGLCYRSSGYRCVNWRQCTGTVSNIFQTQRRRRFHSQRNY